MMKRNAIIARLSLLAVLLTLAACGGGSGGSGTRVSAAGDDVPGGCTANCGAVLQLSWNANLEADVVGYKLYHGTNPGRYDAPILVQNGTTYQYATSVPGPHYFAVSAVDSSQNESPKSQEVVVNVVF